MGPDSVEKFKGSNYGVWKKRIVSCFLAHDVYEAIEGSAQVQAIIEAKGTDLSVEDKKLLQKERKAFSILLNALADEQMSHIQDVDTSSQALDKLDQIYEVKVLSNSLQIFDELISMKMTSGQTMTGHLARAKALSSKLKAIGKDIDENQLVLYLLRSLPQDYDVLVISLESHDESTLTWDYVSGRLLHEELRQASRSNASTPNEHGLFAKRGKGNFIKRGSNVGGERTNGKLGKPIGPCYNCGKMGHLKRDCRSQRAMITNIKTEKSKSEHLLAASNLRFTDRRSWYLDSGCSAHMTPNRDWFLELKEIHEPVYVHLGDDHRIEAEGIGNIKISSDTDDDILVTGVYYVPSLAASLLSVSALDKKGATISFSGGLCHIHAKKKLLMTAKIVKEGLYLIQSTTLRAYITHENPPSIKKDSASWHERCGHIGDARIAKAMEMGVLPREKIKKGEETCESCLGGKMTRKPFHMSLSPTTKVLELIGVDLVGPMEVASIGSARYMLTFSDYYSSYTKVGFITGKEVAAKLVIEFINQSERETGKKLRALRSDNGTEFVNRTLSTYLRENGISQELTVPYNPSQNGKVERMNRTIVEMARSMLIDSGLPKEFWAEAANTACFIFNRLPTSTGRIPYEDWHEASTSLTMLKKFGSFGHSHVPKEKRAKWDPKTKGGFLVGYAQEGGAYKMYDPKEKRIFISRDVSFNESVTYNCGAHKNATSVFPPPSSVFETPSNVEDGRHQELEGIVQEPQLSRANHERNIPIRQEVSSDESSEDEMPHEIIGYEPSIPYRRSQRLNEKGRVSYNPTRLHSNLATFSDSEIEPQNYYEAMNSKEKENWEKAMKEEISSLKENGTWALEELPKGSKEIGSKWVFKKKRDSSGNVSSFKARLVAQGFSQREGIDFNDTFAPVARFDVIRILLATAARENWFVHQMDVCSAYLNGKVSEKIYMKQPEGFAQEGNGHLSCRLIKSLYGQKQAGFEWYEVLRKFLDGQGFTRCVSDLSTFVRNKNGVVFIVCVYVDDILLFTNNLEKLKEIKESFMATFKMKDLKEVHHFLGVRVSRNNGYFYLDQSAYGREVLERFSMENCTGSKSPLPENYWEVIENMEVATTNGQKFPIREAIGSLNYLATATRPDLAYCISFLSQFMESSDEAIWGLLKKALRYLKNTLNLSLVLGGTDQGLEVYMDSDWAGDHLTRKSTSGAVVMYGGSAVAWLSRRQPVVSLSSAEAEYVSITEASKLALWVRNILLELNLKHVDPIDYYIDNHAAIAIANGKANLRKVKHITLKYHFVKDLVESKKVALHPVPSAENAADVFTKNVNAKLLDYLVKKMGLLPTSLSGGVVN